jgi:MoxR-like ATPase
MEEQEVSVEGRTYKLANPFFIIATMNLKGAHLFPLPAPQLDRFMVQLSMGYPASEDEAAIIMQHGKTDSWADFGPCVGSRELLQWKASVDSIEIHPDVVSYIVACVRRTREHPDVQVGASPRTGVKVSRFVRALTLLRGEDYVNIDTVKELFVPAVAHRLVMNDPAQPSEPIIEEILDSVPVDGRRN